MSASRKRRLFPRTLDEVVKSTTSPLIQKQGKFYHALLRDWPTIMGARAASMRPVRVQFAAGAAENAVLHLEVSAALAPELAYQQEQILEQLARYFGYRAIGRLVLHPTHALAAPDAPMPEKIVAAAPPTALPDHLPRELKSVFARLQQHLSSRDDKRE
jgi:hypothetical protein